MSQKRGLCIGINNYPGTGSDLAGCVNDANDWAGALAARGFSVTTLLDQNATKAAMVQGIRGLLAGTQSGDTAVLTYSGHGSWLPDQNGDEADGRDEALCPYDYQSGLLVDDELFTLFMARPAGVRLVFLSDSCHSGTVARFAPALPAADPTARRVRFLPPENFLSPKELASVPSGARPASAPGRRAALLIAGCRDTEYSYDASFGGRPNGAFTRAALTTLPTLPASATYDQWFRAIRTYLPSQSYPQTPQIDGTASMRAWQVLA